nr:hypothetical protein [uncultured Acetatifactor sp.]
MGKKIFAIALAMMMLSAPVRVHAETSAVEGSVTFTEENKLDSNGTTDLNAAVGAMQPGDEIVIEIKVNNTSGQAANYYMTNEVMNSLEDTEGSNASGGAYEYILTYTASDGSTTDLFRSTAIGGTGATVDGRVGLKGATSGLEEYIYLETLESGKQGIVRLQVGLDGETQGNSYQGTAANLQMNFAVDTDTTTIRNVTQTVTRNETVEVVDDTNPGTGGEGADGTGGQRNGTVVRTSDDTNLTPFFIAAGISGILLLILAVFGIKERKRQRGAGTVLTLCLALGLSMISPATAKADYTYTVRLYAGAQGVIESTSVVEAPGSASVEIKDGGAYLEISGLNYGDRINFNANVVDGTAETVSLKADPETGVSKYYVQGVRESGAEINVGTDAVTEDKDYVVSYGVRGSMAYYTVNYVDQQGNTLFPSQRYSGKVGDFAVVAYRYVEGYQPYAYNLGKTLTENEAENVFNFVYTPLPEVVNTTTQTVTNTTTVVVPGPAQEEEPEGEAPVVVVPPEEPETPVEPVVEDIPDEPVPEAEPEEPEDFVNLDEEPTPMAPGPDEDGDGHGLDATIEDFATPLAALPVAAKAGIAACMVMAVGAVVWFLIAHRKKENKEDDAE